MIKIGNTELRNLEEQVLFNSDRIDAILEGDQILAELGIKVVGQVTTAAQLPAPLTYGGEFGDAYLVGSTKPYDFYIFTRPFAGQDAPQWFNLGPFPVAGPTGATGATGPAGPAGKRGSQWFSANVPPTSTAGFEVGDYVLVPNTGNIYHLHNVEGVLRWLPEGSIKGQPGPAGATGATGPQGIQGPQGERGPAGPAGPIVDVLGYINSVDELPDPTIVSRQAAYLLTDGEQYRVYIIIGDDPSNYEWFDAGYFATGTQVLVNNSPVQTFNADIKLDKNTTPNRVYGVGGDGNLQMYTIDINKDTVYSIARRDQYGALRVATPTLEDHATTKKYVDDLVATNAGGGGTTLYRHNVMINKEYNGYESQEAEMNFVLHCSYISSSNQAITSVDQIPMTIIPVIIEYMSWRDTSGEAIIQCNNPYINTISQRFVTTGIRFQEMYDAIYNPDSIVYTDSMYSQYNVNLANIPLIITDTVSAV